MSLMSSSSWLTKAAKLQVTIPSGTSEQCIKRMIRITTDSHSRSPANKNFVFYINYMPCLGDKKFSPSCLDDEGV